MYNSCSRPRCFLKHGNKMKNSCAIDDCTAIHNCTPIENYTATLYKPIDILFENLEGVCKTFWSKFIACDHTCGHSVKSNTGLSKRVLPVQVLVRAVPRRIPPARSPSHRQMSSSSGSRTSAWWPSFPSPEAWLSQHGPHESTYNGDRSSCMTQEKPWSKWASMENFW